MAKSGGFAPRRCTNRMKRSALEALRYEYVVQFLVAGATPRTAPEAARPSHADASLSDNKKRETSYYREQVREI